MTKHPALAAAAFVALAAARPAHAWQYMEAMNAYGDSVTGIVQPARNDASTTLAVGCDGDRWRVVAVGPSGPAGVKLDGDGVVRLAYGPDLGPKETWQVRKRGTRGLAYLAPVASALVRDMLGHEDASADAVLRVAVRSKGKQLVLEFPLAGLRAAIRKDLWEKCKLGNYIPESEFDRK